MTTIATRQTAFKKLKDSAGVNLLSAFHFYANNRSLLTFKCSVPSCNNQFRSSEYDYTTNTTCIECRIIDDGIVEKLIQKHGHYYTYENLESINTLEPMDNAQILSVRCPKHGLFNPTFKTFLEDGIGCKHCMVETISSRDELTTYINNAHTVHGFNYKYGKTVLDGIKTIIVTCPKHGDFEVDPDSHLTGRGCFICEQSGAIVKEITDMLTNASIAYSTEKTFTGCISNENRALRFNIFIPEKNMCIEIDGPHHFQPTMYSDNVSHDQAMRYFEIQTRNDTIKHEYCIQNGIHLVRLSFCEHNPGKTIQQYLSTLPDKRKIYSWGDFEVDMERVFNYIKTFNYSKFAIYGVSRGGVPFSVHISNHFENMCEWGVVGFQRYDSDDKTVTHQINHKTENLPIFIIDDLISSGITMKKVIDSMQVKFPNAPSIHPIVIFGASNEHNIFYIREHPKQWIVFPYEI